MKVCSFAASVAALLIVCGCSAELVLAIPVPENTRIIEHGAVSLADRDVHIRLVEDLVLRPQAGELDSSFYRPRDLAVDEAGSMYVLDASERRVQVFDSTGRHLRSIGSAGQGPEELESPTQVVVVDGEVIVADGANLEVWATNGEFLRSVRAELPPRGLSELLAFGEAGLLCRYSSTGDLERPLETTTEAIARISYGGQIELVFHTALLQETIFPRGHIPVPLGFPGLLLAVGNPGVAYLVDPKAYQVVAVDVQGKPRWSAYVGWRPTPFSEHQVDRAMATLARVVPDGSRSEVRWPQTNPAIAEIATDGSGRLYVVPDFSARPEGTTEVAVDVYDQEGNRVLAGMIDSAFVAERGAYGDKVSLWRASAGELVYGFRRDPVAGEIEIARYRLVLPEAGER